jgi:hypothetical protein
MLDNQLFKLIFSLLTAGFQSIGQGSIICQQSYQPTQEGINTDPTLFVYKVSDERMGFPARNSVQGIGASTFTGSILGNVLTVTAISAGTLRLNQQITGTGLPNNLVITQLGTGTGGVGTYIINYALGTVKSQAMASNGAQTYTETQQYATTFQASALATQDPSDTESLTASDIANLAAYVLQSGSTIAGLEAVGVGVLRVPQVRNPYFTDDRERYEASPSFDFTLTHKQIVTTVIPVIVSDELQVLSV